MNEEQAVPQKLSEKQAVAENAEIDIAEAFQKIAQATAEELYSFAYHFYQHRKYEEATAFFRTLLLFDERNVDNWTGLAASLKMNKQYSEAVAAYRITLTLNPNDPLLYFYLADCCHAMGQIEDGLKAIDAAELAAAGQPQYQKLISQLAILKQAWSN